MRDGGDWIIYLFVVLFVLHICITVGVLIYKMTMTKEVKERKKRMSEGNK